MQPILRFIPLCMLLFACSALPPPSAPAAAPFDTGMAQKHVMEWVIDPAADVIWDSVKTIISAMRCICSERLPQTPANWRTRPHAALQI